MLKFSNIRKSFSGVEVLHDVSFTIEENSITGLIGENGAGKSTLMKITSGVITDYEGEIILNEKNVFFNNPREAERSGISIIHQELNLIPDLTVAENIFLGREPLRKFGFVNFNKLYSDADKILKEFEFPYPSNVKVRNLSIGWQQIVEIARVFSIDSKVIIMDEPTSALSESEIKILFDKIKILKNKGKTIIFISHRLEEIEAMTDDIAVLRDGEFIGKYSSSGIKRDEIISKMIGKKFFETSRKNKLKDIEEVMSLKEVSIFYKDKVYLSNISFNLNKGEIIGIAGLLGSGKTELLKFLFGELRSEFTGEILLKNKHFRPRSASHSLSKNIFYLSKNRKNEGIFSELDLIKNSSISILSEFSSVGFINQKSEKNAVNSQLSDLNVRKKSLRQPIKTLSGGNQQKVLLGRGLLSQPEILLLDEPTRGIDVGAKEEIYKLLNDLSRKGISVIASSSEIPELLRICDKIIVLSHGKQTAVLTTKETNAEEILFYALV